MGWEYFAAELAVGREVDVVELDLVEALRHGLLGDGDGVSQTSSRKGSTQASFSLSIRACRCACQDGPIGTVLGEHVVEGDDARDGVDIARLEEARPFKSLMITAPCARLEGERHRGAVWNEAAVAFGVDDDGIELRARHEIEHPLADHLISHAVVGQMAARTWAGRDGHGPACREAAELVARGRAGTRLRP